MGPPRASTTGLVSAIASVVPGIALLWLGVPFVTAGRALRWGSRDCMASGAGTIAVGLAALYVYALVD